MTKGAASAESAPRNRRWSGQHIGAHAVRVGIAALPTITATIAVICLIQLMPRTDSVAARLGWIFATSVAGFLVASATARFAVRLLPLAALMRLSLVFPDQAPSRLKLAIRATSSRHLKTQVESARHHGLSSEATEAAGQVLLLTAALGEHDRRTRGHSERVRLYARLLGEELGIAGDDLERLQWGALLHDVGKLTIPSEILNKPGALDRTEQAIMSGHAASGSELVEPLHPFLGRFVHAADGHHEKWDGSGYPLGLRGEQIPLAARIVAVADAYEVMTANRPYKTSMSPDAARAELTACAGTHFDPEVVRAWLRLSIGEVNKAAGPVAALAGIPLIGEVFALFARTASQISTVPAAAAAIAPAAATAGAMTVAMVAAPPPPPADLALNLSATTTWTPAPTTAPPTTAPPTTAPPTTAPPSTGRQAEATATTQAAAADTTTTSTQPSTTQPATTEAAAQPTTTQQSAPPSTLPTDGIITRSRGPGLTVAGPITAGADLSFSGSYGDGAFLFQDPARTLTTDLDLDGTIIASGTTVCVHLFLTSEAEKDLTWRIDYGTNVLALAKTAGQLAATDWLSARGVDYGDQRRRGLGDDDKAQIIRNGTRVRLKLDDDRGVSVRILLDCSS